MPLPREISEAEIAAAIEGLRRCARLAIEVAGFDGIEIHGANAISGISSSPTTPTIARIVGAATSSLAWACPWKC